MTVPESRARMCQNCLRLFVSTAKNEIVFNDAKAHNPKVRILCPKCGNRVAVKLYLSKKVKP